MIGYILSALMCMCLCFVIRVYYAQQATIKKQLEDINKILSQKKSSEVRLGQISEHFAPLLKDFPYDTKNARFLGSPIDLIVFDIDEETESRTVKDIKEQEQLNYNNVLRTEKTFPQIRMKIYNFVEFGKES